MFKFLSRSSAHKPSLPENIIPEFPQKDANMFQIETFPSIPSIPNTDKLGLISDKIDKNVFTNTVSSKYPVEVVMNEDKENFCLRDPPFKVRDRETGEIRDFQQEDGYMYFMSKLRDSPENRHPKLKFLFCITIFSESLGELRDTLKSLYNNLNYFQKHNIEEKQIACFVIFDGIQPISDDIRKNVFHRLDIENDIPVEYQLETRQKQYEDDVKRIARGETPKLPIMSSYLYEWEFGPEDFYEGKDYPADNVHYLKVFMAVKIKNGMKISSVVWFFRGYCELFQPEYCSLMDCGTIPYDDAIWKSFMAFEADPQIGGTCGYIVPSAPVTMDKKDLAVYSQIDPVSKAIYKIFDLRTSQIFEYGFGHVFDKAFESVVGCIYVLPGAFSALRWDAIRKRPQEYMDKYMKYEFVDRIFVPTVLDPKYKDRDEYTLQLANMCLAEDQMLTFEVCTKQGCGYITKYLPDSVALTDPVKTLPVLMKQRKRWINGSWYANLNIMSVYFKKLAGTTHTTSRKFWFHFFWFYIYVVNISRYFILSYFFSLIFIFSQEVLNSIYASDFPFASVQAAFLFSFLGLLYTTFHYSLFCKPDQAVRQFQLIVTVMGFYVHIFTCLVIVKVINIVFLQDSDDEQFIIDKWTVVALSSFNLLFYLVPVLLNIKKSGRDMAKTFLAFYFHFPLYFVFFQIYAFCNTNDLSWGTKAKESDGLSEKMEKFKMFNVAFTAKWILWNSVFCFVSMMVNSNDLIRANYILGYAYLFTFFCLIKFIGSVLFKFKYDCFDSRRYAKNAIKKKNYYAEESKNFITFYLAEMRYMLSIEKEIRT